MTTEEIRLGKDLIDLIRKQAACQHELEDYVGGMVKCKRCSVVTHK